MLSQRVDRQLRLLACRSGFTSIYRRILPKPGCIILYGHRVQADDEGYLSGLRPDWFADQLEYLTRHYEIIPLETLIDCLARRVDPPNSSVVLTFDDGFRDNYENAFPLLRKFSVPATIFVVTQSLTDGLLPWPQRLGFVFQNTTQSEVFLPEFSDEPFDLSGPKVRRAAYMVVKRALASRVRVARDAAIREIERKLQVAAPLDRMLTWEQARELSSAGVQIGAHTYSHPLLALMPPDEAEMEMRRSFDDVKREIGEGAVPFCFPGGSFNDRLASQVPELGFCGVFRPGNGVRINNSRNAGPFSMGRVGLPNECAEYLEGGMDGPLPAIRKLFGRV